MITATIDKEQFDHFIRRLPEIAKAVAVRTAKDITEGARLYYIDTIKSEMKNNGRDFFQKESIKKVTTDEEFATDGKVTYILQQTSRAGYMMEVDKANVGGVKLPSGKRALFRGMKGAIGTRADAYLDAIGADFITLSNDSITGIHPLKPMEITFEDYVIPEYQKEVKSRMIGTIRDQLVSSMPQLPKKK